MVFIFLIHNNMFWYNWIKSGGIWNLILFLDKVLDPMRIENAFLGLLRLFLISWNITCDRKTIIIIFSFIFRWPHLQTVLDINAYLPHCGNKEKTTVLLSFKKLGNFTNYGILKAILKNLILETKRTWQSFDLKLHREV